MSDFLLSRVQIHRNESLKTGPMDEWCTQFLPVLFERKSIKQFNTGMFLDDLKQLQEPEHFSIVQVRWQAIQAYFMGDVAKCVDYIEQALKLAKDANQPQWVIKDILIDLRNESMVLGTINNHLKVPDAQKELTDSEEELYYPILDRIHTTLHEKYIEGLYKQKTESPYSVTLGSNIHEMGALLASSCIVAMYNGSLTHILLLFDKIRDCLFYLSSRYSDWNFRRDLLKMVIYGGSAKEIKGIQDSYPEIINILSVQDADNIMSFCENQPIPYKRLNSQLLAFGSVGYFLDDTSFQKYETMLIDEIKTWLNAEVFVAAAGQNTFTALTGVAHRISQDTLCDICCMFIDRHYSRWYSNMFKFIAEKIRIDEMQHDSAVKLISHIISILDNEADRRLISNSPTFLSILRKQSIELTTALDEKIAQCLPAYYDGFYKLNTSEDTLTDHPKFIQEYVELILKDNASQGKNGVYAGRGIRLHETIRLILLAEDMQYEASIMDSVISASAETIVKSQEDISTKLDAVALLICIAFKYPEDYKRNSDVYKDIYSSREDIKVSELALVSSNIDTFVKAER